MSTCVFAYACAPECTLVYMRERERERERERV